MQFRGSLFYVVCEHCVLWAVERLGSWNVGCTRLSRCCIRQHSLYMVGNKISSFGKAPWLGPIATMSQWSAAYA